MWAKVVNDEIMQLWEENPENLWHPDAMEFWQEVPDTVHIGWKLKDGEWISGSQWLEEYIAENPPPPPGPPTANMNVDTNLENNVVKVTFSDVSVGHVDTVKWIINGKTYTDKNVELSFEMGDTLITESIDVKLEVKGPGGTDTLEKQEKVKVGIATV